MLYYKALAQALADNEVETIFGVLGDANLFAIDAWQREHGGRYLSFAHEGGTVLAASGYSSTSGKLGVATITHGPALTNTVTALVDCVRARVPLLLVAGDTPSHDRAHLQSVEQRKVVEATGALFEPAGTPATVAQDVSRAIRRALTERLPVVLNIPIDFQWQEIDAPSTTFTARPVKQAVRPDPIAMEEALGVIANASRPLILGGRGARDARTALEKLAARLGAPVATTLRGKGLFSGNPHSIGIFGTLSHQAASDVISRADVVVAFGASLNRWTTYDGDLLQGKRIVHVDDDPVAIARWISVDAGVIGDAATVAQEMVEWLDRAGVGTSSFASDDLAATLAKPAPLQDNAAETGYVDLVDALRRIDRAFPSDRTLVIDDGRFIFSAYAELSAPSPDAYVHTCSFASIGLAMSNAIGAYEGAPSRPVLVVCGDGGFMSAGLTEFNTAVRHGTDTVVIIMNDAAYGAEHMQFTARDMDPTISCFDWPDLGPVATALGGSGYTVRSAEELDHVLGEIGSRDRPVLIDVKLDPMAVPGERH